MGERWHSNVFQLEPAPIRPEWIIEGEPVTRCRMLCGSTDDRAFTAMWDCTAGRFNWYYDVDETVYLVEGSVILTNEVGQRRTLHATDTFFFAAGTRYEWIVPVYVRKIAFLHFPLPAKLRRVRQLYQTIRRWWPRAQGAPRGSSLQGH